MDQVCNGLHVSHAQRTDIDMPIVVEIFLCTYLSPVQEVTVKNHKLDGKHLDWQWQMNGMPSVAVTGRSSAR